MIIDDWGDEGITLDELKEHLDPEQAEAIWKAIRDKEFPPFIGPRRPPSETEQLFSKVWGDQIVEQLSKPCLLMTRMEKGLDNEATDVSYRISDR